MLKLVVICSQFESFYDVVAYVLLDYTNVRNYPFSLFVLFKLYPFSMNHTICSITNVIDLNYIILVHKQMFSQLLQPIRCSFVIGPGPCVRSIMRVIRLQTAFLFVSAENKIFNRMRLDSILHPDVVKRLLVFVDR